MFYQLQGIWVYLLISNELFMNSIGGAICQYIEELLMVLLKFVS